MTLVWNMPMRVFIETSMDLMIISVIALQHTNMYVHEYVSAVCVLVCCVVLYIVLMSLTLTGRVTG